MGAWAQTVLQKRLEWQSFKSTPQYGSLLTAIRRMKANTNAADPNSWSFWKNIHVNRCPHGIAYFLSWHRGYLYHFERQLRVASGDYKLVLPYWDYYSYATLPPEFTNASSTNPLYVPRLNTNVRQALTLAPFSATVTNFQRGLTYAFEPVLEDGPHNRVHDIIGNVMSSMDSPNDPVFWLHHANVDRLWAAWVYAGAGRRMPAKTSTYWLGTHIYSSTHTTPRTATYDTRTNLAYYYQNETMPATLPLARLSDRKVYRVQARKNERLTPVPPPGLFRASGRKPTGETTFSIGGALGVGLDQRSVSAQFPLLSEDWAAVQEIARGNAASVRGSTKKYKSVQVVLDNVELADEGANGGYFYEVYFNLPSADGTSAGEDSLLIGTLGAFRINGAAHHGGTVQLSYPLPRGRLRTALRLGIASISFVRVDGDNSPRGATIGIGEARLELSTEDKDS
jgi:tyrosinase